jgi:hypothetical protein
MLEGTFQDFEGGKILLVIMKAWGDRGGLQQRIT